MATTTCPVCDAEITDGGVKVQVEGNELTVCCQECAADVEANPTEYVSH